MLRFPLRLTADLTKALIAQKLQGASGPSPILVMHPVEQGNLPGLDSGKLSTQTKTGTELMASVRESFAPVVWIGGPEPLFHPEIGQLARCIAGIGRHVFLETDGTLLRRRIHEFRPVSRLFLTVQLNGLEKAHDLRAGGAGAFQLATEGIRAARLSGFLICVHARVDAATQLSEMAELIRFAETLDVDGFMISRAAGAALTANRDEEVLQRKIAEARQLLGSIWWERFSALVQTALIGEHQPTHAADMGRSIVQEEDTSEEGVRVA
jgi:MoaA/NifB/PqqE/SkfB family radical SAM enzyme